MPVQVHTVDCVNELLWNDGEGITYPDLQAMQTMSRRALGGDGMMRHLVERPGTALRLRPVRQALATEWDTSMTVEVQPGFVFWDLLDGSLPGATANAWVGAVMEAAQSIVVDAADGSNPRYDILSAKVEVFDGGSETRHFEDATTHVLSSQSLNKRRYSRITITYTPGTPAASPAEPSVPSGESRIARIEVAAGASALTQNNIIDYRAPAGYTKLRVPMGAMFGGSDWSRNLALGGTWSALATPSSLIAELNVPALSWTTDFSWRDAHLRLRSIRSYVKVSTGGTYELKRHDQRAAAGDEVIDDLSGDIVLDTTGFYTSLFNGIAHPITWLSGGRSPGYYVGTMDDPTMHLHISSGAIGDLCRLVVAEFFGGF